MSKFLSRFRDDDDEDEFTPDEIAAAEIIIESSGKKVVSNTEPLFADNQCFICRSVGCEGTIEKFTTNNSSYNLFVCSDCISKFKTK